jgi:hypothetical protein
MRARFAVCCLFILEAASLMGQVEMTTWHNDIARTGQNTNEMILTRALVGNVNSFGKLCSVTIDGQVFAQPLVANVTFGGVQHTAVFVVTKNDTVYAFDGIHYTPGQPCLQLAKRHLPPSGFTPYDGGILGTPVIDPATKTLYLVAEMAANSTPAHYFHALDLTSAALPNNSAPVKISGGTFVSANAVQRPGLLGIPSTVGGPFSAIYVAFARTGNTKANHRGWVFSFRAPDLVLQSFYCVTCGTTSGNGGGIWMGGAGLAAGKDSSGATYHYVATGDGDFNLNTGGRNSGDSFLKMSRELSFS